MHSFVDLVERRTAFTLESLRETQEQVIDALQTSAGTPLVKALQMVQLQKAIFAIGMFSIFEAILQDRLACTDGFLETRTMLTSAGELALEERFGDFFL